MLTDEILGLRSERDDYRAEVRRLRDERGRAFAAVREGGVTGDYDDLADAIAALVHRRHGTDK